MSRDTTCPPCQIGDHKRHYRIVQHAPEDGVGGAVCTCDGECKDGRYMDPTGRWLRDSLSRFRKVKDG